MKQETNNSSRFFITGDCHGDFEKIEFFCRYHETTPDDCMIILGDAGINFCMDHRDEELKNALDKMPLTFLCVHGNHEERPYNISSYRTKVWHGGLVYYEDAHPTILFAKDGEMYEMNGKKVIAIGGAYSGDKAFRIMLGLPWFPDEQPSKEIKKYVEAQLDKQQWTVDYVLSHTCPMVYEPREKYQNLVDAKTIDKSTEQWLDQIAKKLAYKCWYFGHYHDNVAYDDAELLYEEIKELGEKDFLQKLGRPKYRVKECVFFPVKNDGREDDGYGVIEQVHEYGTENQRKEISYHIKGIICGNPDQKMDFPQVKESVIESINELMEK